MKFLLFFFFMVFQLGLFSQSFVLDTTFKPFFDIRHQRYAVVSDGYENPSGKLFFSGNFELTLPPHGIVHYDLISIYRDGDRNFNFTGDVGGEGIIKPLSDSILLNGRDFYGFIDTNGNRYNYSWHLTYRKSVRCSHGVPYFFQDGSSLFGNGRDNSGEPCFIITPPDTFPGRHIIKLTPEGHWDSTFTKDANHALRGFFPYDSNRILVYGHPWRLTHYDGVKIDGLFRIFFDGTLDTSFHSPLNSNLGDQFFDPDIVEEDGGFFILGSFYLKGQNNIQTLVRLNADGSLDSTFLNFQNPHDTSLWNSGVVRSIVKTDDNGYLVGGRFNKYQGHHVHSIAKIDSRGKLEPQYFTSPGPDSSSFFGTGYPTVMIILKSKLGGYYVGGDFLYWDNKPSQPILRIKLDTTTGIKENSLPQPNLSIFPNPAGETVTIECDLPIEKVVVLDILGKITSLKSYSKTATVQSLSIGELPSGVYLLNIQLKNGQSLSKKLVKK